MSDKFVGLITAASDEEKLNLVCNDIVSDIEKRSIQLVEVVTHLGQLLTNQDVSQRELGVNVLSTILSKLSRDFLNEKELQPITLFYCDRLKDHFSIIPLVIRGIHHVVQMKNLPKDGPFNLLTALFRDIRCQSENPRTRRIIYAIFEVLLSTRLKDLQEMGPDFIYGFISCIDGECDPTSLHLLFKLLPKILKNFSLGHLTEEMFEILACYFPVDFQTEGRDGTGITRDHLVQGLEDCLSSVPGFAEFCLPLIIEKLESNLRTAKYDSLHLLARSASTYGIQAFHQHPDLWPAMRTEILSGSDQELKETALLAVTEITRVLSEDESILKTFIDRIFDDTKWHLCNEDKSMFWAAEKLVEAVGRASELSLRLVLKVIVPLCIGQYSSKTSEQEKIILMETLSSFMALCSHFGFKISDVPELSWTDLPSLYLNELSSAKETLLKSKALEGLAIQKLSLTEHHRQILYDKVSEEIDRGCESTKVACSNTLMVFAQLHPNEVWKIVQEQLSVQGDHEITIFENRLEALTSIAQVPDLGPKILPIIVQVIVSGRSDTLLAALNCLEKLLSVHNCDFNISGYLYKHCNAIEQLLNVSLARIDCSAEHQRHLSNVSRLIIRKLDAEEQKAVIDKHICDLKSDIEKDVLLLEGILTPVLPPVISEVVTDLLDDLIVLSLRSSCPSKRLSACKLLSVIVNKMNHDEKLEKYLYNIQKQVNDVLYSDNSEPDVREAAVVLHTWATKAVIIRGSNKTSSFMNNQYIMLRNEKIGDFVGQKFRIFVDKDEQPLTEDNFCTIRLFYKQRILQDVLEHNSTFTESNRASYLTALINLVEGMPLELLFLQLTKIVPLLIESLALDNSQSLTLTLRILKQLLEKKDGIFIAQIQDFIPKCLNLSTYPEMNVRMSALDCLASYCSYPVVSIKPYKDNVIEKLSETVDDKKRLVRQMAVAARARWFLIGSPGGPE